MLQPATSRSPARAAIHARTTLSGGAALALIGYLLLWIVLFPFTCWGTVADPGHAHRHPHLVFAHLPDENLAPSSAEAGLLSVRHPAPAADASLHRPIRGVVAQAIPTMLLGLAVWLFLRGARTHLLRPAQSTQPFFGLLDGRAPFLPVPTPPPRPA